MRSNVTIGLTCILSAGLVASAFTQRGGGGASPTPVGVNADPVRMLVSGVNDLMKIERFTVTDEGDAAGWRQRIDQSVYLVT